MNRTDAVEYLGGYVDDALSPDPFKADDGHLMSDQEIATDSNIRLVGWQCGFEPLFVAVRSYLDLRLDDDEAEELAVDLLVERGWFSGEPKEADYIL
jgi:hypothetical protein